MSLWDAKKTLRILHFRYYSYQKRYFTVFNNYIYIIFCMPRSAKKREIFFTCNLRMTLCEPEMTLRI